MLTWASAAHSIEYYLHGLFVACLEKGETTLEREFPGYVYGKAQWAAEGLAERANCLISHRLAGKGPRGTAAVETQTELSDEAGVVLAAEKPGPAGGLQPSHSLHP